MWVIKIGGSLAKDPLLVDWLEHLNDLGGGRVVIVPGGGDYADGVRHAQAEWHLDDVVAHNMAVLGMGQFAFMLQGLCPDLVIAADELELEKTVHSGRVALWMPLQLLRREADELTTWDVTSDSLALWLANRLNAERVILVKSCPIPATTPAPDEWPALSAEGIVDRRFPALASEAAYPIHLLERTDLARLRELLLDATVV
ncbi:aspartate/glutamate/uridylate kinase [Azoarcus sp. KH32C]|uniref:amino acid kinase family protein n=1 Tax=Azoarcus sp. KH32C TaxID=748247 RepID=UPI0002385DDF|nr:aspartate/glutamate/uridylate kinase [Azoarcus sp. KH32C]BAL27146.1 aspartate/glutamate/uridylate kinase [Azoarcus sp. KH32C]